MTNPTQILIEACRQNDPKAQLGLYRQYAKSDVQHRLAYAPTAGQSRRCRARSLHKGFPKAGRVSRRK
ncbi:hypothetical protein CCAN2_1940018 [Capnocytophaga canimorsus]|nr:hypothetical protein CCAN2_1940018 [Capnocytophaga canimorsus]